MKCSGRSWHPSYSPTARRSPINKTKIDYTDQTWNPITGCRHRCDYCYGKKLVDFRGLYGGSFEPQFHHAELSAPFKEKEPCVIFVCNMGDIFSPGVKKIWRDKVKKAADKAPWHTYLWLSKNPQYDASWVKPNWWLGATITGPEDAWKREVVEGENIWYSYEPLFGVPERGYLYDARQVIIGRATNYKSEWCLGWAAELTRIYLERNTMVFWKENIKVKGPRNLVWERALMKGV